MSLIQEWRNAFHAQQRACPWPGPRPIDTSTAVGFVDRQADVDALLHQLRNNSLVVFHGESGAGKTSLINVKVIEHLFVQGYAPMLCRDWANCPGPQEASIQTVDGFLAQKLHEADWLADPLVRQLRDRSLADALDDQYGNRAVIILDQFEEVLRSNLYFARSAIEWVLEANHNHAFKVVISMRSEQLYAITERLRDAQPFTTYYLKLRRLEGEVQARRIITAPQSLAENLDGVQIEEDAVDKLAMLWSQPVRDGRNDKNDVLGLQACLFVLYFARVDREKPIAIEDVKRLIDEAEAAEVGDIFRFSLQLLMDFKLDFARKASQGVSSGEHAIPRSLVLASQRAIVNMVAFLSSGDYKVERALPELFRLSLARPLLSLGLGEQIQDLLPMMLAEPRSAARGDRLDYLAESAADLAAAWGFPPLSEEVLLPARPQRWLDTITPLPWSSRDDVRDRDAEERQRGSTAGPVFGFERWRVLVELARAFLFAIEWLETASLIRVSDQSVALIHDGFGPALSHWSARHEMPSRWEAALSLMALDGEFLRWSDPQVSPDSDEDPSVEFRWPDDGSSEDPPQLVVNARWVNSAIRDTSFNDVAFVNCDLHATAFINCRFAGAIFVNCRLDGAMFKECEFVGSIESWLPGESDSTKVDDFPRYHILGSANTQVLELVQELAWYRDGRADTGGDTADKALLYSPQSGAAAVPLQSLPPDLASTEFRWPQGGLVVAGGRLSALLMLNCRFIDVPEGHHAVAFSEIAGSSLDLVEQQGAMVHIRDSAIRGLTVSAPLEGVVGGNGALHLEVLNSSIYGAFFGPGVRGEALLDHCLVLGATNCSPELTATISHSRAGQHNLGTGEGITPIDPASGDALFQESPTRAIIYRSQPGRFEYYRQKTSDEAQSP